MTTPFIAFARPDIGEEEIAAVTNAMRSGWVTTGPETRAFEQEFADFIGGGVQAIADGGIEFFAFNDTAGVFQHV